MIKISRKIFKTILEAIALALLLIFLFGLWKINNSPVISLTWLTKYVTAALTPIDNSFNVKIEKTILSISFKNFTDIKAYNVQVNDRENNEIAHIPVVNIDFSLKALLGGKIAPSKIALYNPNINIITKNNEDTAPENKEAVPAKKLNLNDINIPLMFNVFFENYKKYPRFKYLNLVKITQGNFRYLNELKNQELLINNYQLNLNKNNKYITSEIDVPFIIDDNRSLIKINTKYNLSSEDLSYKLAVNNIFLPAITSFFDKSFIKNTDVKFNTLLQGNIDLKKQTEISSECSIAGITCERFKNLNYTLSSSKGYIETPAPLENKFPVKQMFIKGYASNGFKVFTINNFKLQGDDNLIINASAKALGVYELIKNNNINSLSINVKADIENVKISALDIYWPKILAPETREWIIQNIKSGYLPKANFNLSFKPDENNEFNLDNVTGKALASDITLSYMEGAPLVDNVEGEVLFLSKDTIKINVTKGNSLGVKLNSASLIFDKLWEDIPMADFTINASGPLSAQIAIADSPALGLAAAVNAKPQDFSGDAETNLKLDFPLLEDVKTEQVMVKVKGKVKNATVKNAIKGKDLTDAELNVDITNDNLELNGEAKILETPLNVGWSEDFNQNISKYSAKGAFPADKINELLGEEIDFIEETPIINLTFIDKGKDSPQFLDIEADLTNAVLKINDINYKKDKKIAAKANISAVIQNDKILSLPLIKITGKNLNIDGKINYDALGNITDIDMPNLIAGNNNNASIKMETKDIVNINIKGKVFDVSKILKENLKNKDNNDQKTEEKDMNIDINVDKLYTKDDIFLNKAEGFARLKNGDVDDVKITALIPDTDNKKLEIFTDRPKNVRLNIISDDDGGAIFQNILGIKSVKKGTGRLIIDFLPNKKSKGHLVAKKCYLKKAPIAAKLLSLTSLTGLLDTLSGEGIYFDRIEAEYDYDGRILKSANTWKAYGSSLGLTANGSIDMINDTLDLEGFIIPSYFMNSLLGRIPIVGKLFSGESGGGLFAFSYSIKGSIDDPKVSVNPLTAFAPGILRNIFVKPSDNGDSK